MKLKSINSFEGQVGFICLRFDDTVFDRAEKIDDDLLVDFADFGVDLVLQSIKGFNLVTFSIHCLLLSSPVILKFCR